MTIKKTTLLLSIIVLSGGAALTRQTPDEQFGKADPARFDTPRAPVRGLSYRADVQPILERRCVVCHACYYAPCQLNLTAWEGVSRGLSKDLVYDGGRLDEAPPSRLFTDAQKGSDWRARNFSPVLNERDQTRAANLAASVMYRALRLKENHPLPDTAILPRSFDFSLDRAQQCPRIDEFDHFERKNPLWGMPFGLPGLKPAEMSPSFPGRWSAESGYFGRDKRSVYSARFKAQKSFSFR